MAPNDKSRTQLIMEVGSKVDTLTGVVNTALVTLTDQGKQHDKRIIEVEKTYISRKECKEIHKTGGVSGKMIALISSLSGGFFAIIMFLLNLLGKK